MAFSDVLLAPRALRRQQGHLCRLCVGVGSVYADRDHTSAGYGEVSHRPFKVIVPNDGNYRMPRYPRSKPICNGRHKDPKLLIRHPVEIVVPDPRPTGGPEEAESVGVSRELI